MEKVPAWLMLRSCSVRCHAGRTCWKYPLQGNRGDIHSRCPSSELDSKPPEGMLGSVGRGLNNSTLLRATEGMPGQLQGPDTQEDPTPRRSPQEEQRPCKSLARGAQWNQEEKSPVLPSVPPVPSPNKIQHCANWGEMFSTPISIFSEQAMKNGFVIERQ